MIKEETLKDISGVYIDFYPKSGETDINYKLQGEFYTADQFNVKLNPFQKELEALLSKYKTLFWKE